jgi:hypothetical protein
VWTGARSQRLKRLHDKKENIGTGRRDCGVVEWLV